MNILSIKFNDGSLKASIPKIFNIIKISENGITIIDRTVSSTLPLENKEKIKIRHNQPLKAIVSNDQLL